jgi:hypothetical protein
MHMVVDVVLHEALNVRHIFIFQQLVNVSQVLDMHHSVILCVLLFDCGQTNFDDGASPSGVY